MSEPVEKKDSKNDNDDNVEEKKDEIATKNPSNTDEDSEFYFFYNLAKRMILKRVEVGDVRTFSRWLKALDENTNKTLRKQYIKLMILALQNPELTCPFKDLPPETLDPLEYGVYEMGRKFRRKEGTAMCTATPPEVPYPSMSTAVSVNKCQYASSHVIPNVVQCFYAFSDEPLYNWDLPRQITVPKKGPHAVDIDWERALAGMQLKSNETSTDLSESKPNSLDKNKLCQVMYIEQKVRNVTEEFTWNDASILTGEIILGAEACTDRKMDVQVKTQPGLDKESTSLYDKLYPGDFKIYAEPSFIEDLVPAKKFMEAGDKKIKTEKQSETKCARNRSAPQDSSNSKSQNGKHGKPCIDVKNVPNSKNNRQSAGHEMIKSRKDKNACVKKQNNVHKNNVLKISTDLSDRIAKSYASIENVVPKNSKTCTDASSEESSGLKKQPSEYDYLIEPVKKRKIAFQKASSDFLRRVSTAEESFEDAMSALRDNNSKSDKTASDTDLDTSDASLLANYNSK